ncbi:MAG: M3 family metallopeptidase, partial [Deltaproteobacteria bacterium]|nr:M3 family metallopeptidase [Deltaproteobacteria bacterium]
MTDSPSWDLGLLYAPDSPELKRDLEELRNRRQAFGAHKELLAQRSPTLEEFGAMVRELESLNLLATNLVSWADLWVAEDVGDQKAQAVLAAMREEGAELVNDVLFFELWWKKLGAEEAERYLTSLPEFEYFLRRERALVEHTLTEAEEKIVNLKNVHGREAHVGLYDALTSRYAFEGANIPGSDGQPMNREELMLLVRSSAPETRAAAYRELYRVFGQDGAILGQIYQELVRDWRQENVRLRHYPNPASVRHKKNDLPEEAVESLLRVCQRKGPEVFGRYFRKKAEVLGLERLRRYDLYAPYGEDQGQWSFEEAMSLVEKSFGAFDPKLAELAKAVWAGRRLDAASRPGKRSGAFCASISPKTVPWVLMTFKGKTQDLFTLAHELGHAAHSQLAREQNVFHFHACLPLAETASTFGEMLLAKTLLSQASEDERKTLTFHLLDDAYATVGRQAFFALFELKAHEMVVDGA